MAWSVKRAALLAGLVGGLLLSSPQAKAEIFHPDTFTLFNGLQVVVIHNRLSPAVAQMVWYKVGATDDPAGHSGLAHFLEHMMFKGTEKVPVGAFSSQIAAQGGEDNAFTTYDATSYHEVVAADRLPLIMQMEADRMRGLQIDSALAVPELSVVLSERQERTDNSPRGRFEEKMRAALFPAHPYGRPVIGWQKEMEKITPQAAQAFYRAHYAPNNAILVISGNVETDEVMRLAAATFGRVPRGDVAPRHALPDVPAYQPQTIVMRDARVQQPSVSIRVIAPSFVQDAQVSYAYDVLTEVLAGGEVGLFYRHFVMDAGLASGIDVLYDSTARGPSLFSIVATPAPQKDVRVLQKKIDAYLAKLAKKGIPAQEVEKAKQRLTDAAVFARDKLMAPAEIIGHGLAVGETIADIETWPDQIALVDKARVDAALRALVANPRRVTGFLLPEEKRNKK